MKLLLAIAAALAMAFGGLWWMKPEVVRDLAASAVGVVPSQGVTAKKSGSPQAPLSPAVAVEVAEARQTRANIEIRAVGSLLSDETVKLAPEIAGRISEIVFAEGRPVKQGDVIVKLDDALVAGEVTQAKARLTLAEANFDRARALSRTGNVTERSRDEAVSTFETAKAELALAETRLSKHTLKAPFAGIAGVRTVSVGAYVPAGTEIVNIEKIDKLKVDFKVPEIHLADIEVGQAIDVTVDALPGRVFKGEIYAINPMVDVNGRALAVRGRIDNADAVLRPGLFARLLVKGRSQGDVIVVPESAILPRGGDTFVFRVDGDKAVEKRVKLGNRREADVEILEGLEPRAMIVVAGQQRLRDGATVEVVARAPAAVDPQPTPEARRGETPLPAPKRERRS